MLLIGGLLALGALGFSQVSEPVAPAFSNPFDHTKDIGRFSLLASEDMVLGENKRFPITFKIDSATGETWTLEQGTLAGAGGFHWSKVEVRD